MHYLSQSVQICSIYLTLDIHAYLGFKKNKGGTSHSAARLKPRLHLEKAEEIGTLQLPRKLISS